MLDANDEIGRLRQRLLFKNLPDSLVDEICDEASSQISSAVSDILAEAMSDAVNAGADTQSTDFIDDLRSVRSGSSFDIITNSGKTDYSEPPFPMLPQLLKNAKVAKDGSLYKVIPMRQKSSNSGRNNSVAVTTEAALQQINNARYKAKEVRDAKKDMNASISLDAMRGGDTFSALSALSVSRQKSSKVRPRSTEPVTEFRTASSKQDSNSKWVNPGRTVNMSNVLRDINMNIQDSIDRMITDVINEFERMY